MLIVIAIGQSISPIAQIALNVAIDSAGTIILQPPVNPDFA